MIELVNKLPIENFEQTKQHNSLCIIESSNHENPATTFISNRSFDDVNCVLNNILEQENNINKRKENTIIDEFKAFQIESTSQYLLNYCPKVLSTKEDEIKYLYECELDTSSNSDASDKVYRPIENVRNEIQEKHSFEQILDKINFNSFRESGEILKTEIDIDSERESKIDSSFLNDSHSIQNEFYENYFEMDQMIESESNLEDNTKDDVQNDQINTLSYYHLIDKNDLDTDVHSNFRHSEIARKIDLNMQSTCQALTRLSLKPVSSVNLVNKQSNEPISRRSSLIKTKSLSIETFEALGKNSVNQNGRSFGSINFYCLLKFRIKHLLKNKK